MKIEADEKEVKLIGSRRFYNKHKKLIMIIMVCWIAACIIPSYIYAKINMVEVTAHIIPLLIISGVILMAVYTWIERKQGKKFLEMYKR